MPAWEGFDCKMYALMSLEIVIAVEALWALIASERSIVLRLSLLRVSVQLLDLSCVTTVESGDHAVWHAANHLHVPVGIIDVR